ncbi:MAG: hypothetical protein PHG82_03235 [Candidatus Gracilibacteria bacterium]|nr:hypothetical protein [Candidatus Gracilibacteria bacterium]
MRHQGILVLGRADLGLVNFFSSMQMPSMYRKSLKKEECENLPAIIPEHLDIVILCDDILESNDIVAFCQKHELNLLSLTGEKVALPSPLNFVFDEMDDYNELNILSSVKRMREDFKNMREQEKTA